MENSQELIGRVRLTGRGFKVASNWNIILRLQVHLEFREMCSQLNIDELLSKFVSSKGTGKEKPSKFYQY